MRRQVVLFLLIIFLGLFSIYNIFLFRKVYPNISVAGFSISGLNSSDATFLLTEKIKIPEKFKIVSQNQTVNINTKDIDLSYNFSESAERAYNFTRTGNILLDSGDKISLLFYPKQFGLITNINENKLNKIISVVAGQTSVDPIYPSVKILNGVVVINKGSAGIQVDQDLLKAKIRENLSFVKSDDVNVPTTTTDPSISDFDASKLKENISTILGKSIEAKFDDQVGTPQSFLYTDSDIIKLIDLKGGLNQKQLNETIVNIASKINRNPQNPKFNFENDRVSEFQPALDGITLIGAEFTQKLANSINNLENSTEKTITFDIPVTKTPPEITTDKVNNLGIKELIGRGSSTYFHSIPGRIHNVSLATSRINGVLIKPGDTFSFNEALGDVSAFTGYQRAYIISEGKTILGDGGGVCQVSSTLFRALLNAGLPIDERSAHAYRVGYYEQGSPPGMDATVYSPSPDLKFTNNTGNYILIEGKADPATLSMYFELYGTKDGRTSMVSKPIVSNVTPPLETVYQDDPTLPAGVVKQVDYSASGAKVVFDYVVTRNGQEIYKKTFISNYRPWAAVYLRGTKI